jgi:hypothetical protein
MLGTIEDVSARAALGRSRAYFAGWPLLDGVKMIIPYRDQNGKRNGFLAAEAVYNLNGRKLGRLSGQRVIDSRGEVVAEISGDLLTITRPLPWPARAIDAFRSALRHFGINRLNELPDQ